MSIIDGELDDVSPADRIRAADVLARYGGLSYTERNIAEQYGLSPQALLRHQGGAGAKQQRTDLMARGADAEMPAKPAASEPPSEPPPPLPPPRLPPLSPSPRPRWQSIGPLRPPEP